MADIAKFVEEIKSMTVLELNELALALLLRLLKRRPSSTLFWSLLAQTRSTLSRLLRKLPAWAWRKLRLWLTRLRRPLRKAFPRTTLRLLRRSSPRLALRSNWSKFLLHLIIVWFKIRKCSLLCLRVFFLFVYMVFWNIIWHLCSQNSHCFLFFIGL